MLILILLLVAGTLAAIIFYMKSRKETLRIDVKKIPSPQESFELSITGPLKNRTKKVNYTVEIADNTDGQATPLRSNTGSMNKDGTILRIDVPSRLLPRQKVLFHWQKILTLPVNQLEMGRQGDRTLVFRVQVNKQGPAAETAINYHYAEKGFLDIKDHLREIYTAVFYLVNGLRNVIPSGSFDQKILNEWLLEEGADWDEEERKNIILQYQELVLNDTSVVDWEEAYHFYSIPIQRHASKQIRNRIIQLFFQLLEKTSDQLSDEQKIEILYHLTNAIGEDLGQFCRLAERVFSESYHQVDEHLRLGIHKNMTTSEIQRRLKEEYKVWNSRVTHPDQQFRKRAERMLELIALKQGQSKPRRIS